MKRLLIVLLLASGTATVGAQEPLDSALARFYAQRWGQAAWVFNGGLSPQAEELLDRLIASAGDGLDPADYSSQALGSLLYRHRSPDENWRLDSLLTRAFLRYARDLSTGRVDPAAADTQWTRTLSPVDLVAALSGAADDGGAAGFVEAVEPPQAGYRALRGALLRYRQLAEAGAWPRDLSRRLAAEGYDTSAGISAAVRKFQTLHGLVGDGVVGPATRAALDVPAAARAAQIAVNLERWRWLPRDLGDRYVVVNSAAFTLQLVAHDSVIWTTRAIVGRIDWPTPIVSGIATAVAFRPVWRVPRLIAARELLPLIKRDPEYLRREGFRVFADSGGRGTEIDPGRVDWQAVSESSFIYQLVQDPGGDNPLGGVKLVFWNPFAVFIHDTPGRHLFSELLRTFSHGCVRTENAAQLVGRLLPDWSLDSVHAAMTTGRERWVQLAKPVPVHLVYWTVWMADDGLLRFAADPYGWDAELGRALQARAASSMTMRGPRQ